MIAVMSVRIAVFDPLPLYRSGILAALSGGSVEPEAPDDRLAWIREEQRWVVFLTLRAAEDWSLLASLREGSDKLVIVAVLEEVRTAAYIQAIHAGASAVMPRSATPETIRRVFSAAVLGETVLPLEVVRGLAGGREPPDPVQDDAPSAQELEWLRQLATGTTVAQLAQQAGYSERAMFRLLSGLYRRMEVGNRVEALFLAHERGWL
jgi:DNA-binding NarL/FixJ family response regulator